jgi:hypothetical protein
MIDLDLRGGLIALDQNNISKLRAFTFDLTIEHAQIFTGVVESHFSYSSHCIATRTIESLDIKKILPNP